MLKQIKSIKENKIFKTIYSIIYTILVILVLLLLVLVILQKTSNNTISLGGFRIFNIISESMVPKYQIGDILLAKAIEPSKIKVGDDVVYTGSKDDFAGRIVTHQVIAIDKGEDGYKFHTKGLANEAEDPLVSENEICGVIIYKMKTLSFLSKILNNLYSLYFAVFIPLVFLAALEIRKIILNMREKDEENEEKHGLEKEDIKESNQDDDNKKE